MRRSLVLSLLLHLAIIYFCWRTHSPAEPAAVPIEITTVAKPAPGAQGGGRSARGKSHRSHALALSQLQPLRPEGELGRPGGVADKDESWGARGGAFGEVVNLPRYQRLFEEIRGLLYYPDRLSYHGISGTVNARLYFTDASYCDWRRSHVSGAHPYLLFYVTALLHKLCALENVEHLRFHAGQYVDISFAFTLVTLPETDQRQVANDRIVGNVLLFERSAPSQVGQWHLGPLRGYLFAPVVSVDFPWIFENWDRYVNGLDPYRDFRD